MCSSHSAKTDASGARRGQLTKIRRGEVRWRRRFARNLRILSDAFREAFFEYTCPAGRIRGGVNLGKSYAI